MRDHLSQLSEEFEHCLPTTKDPQTGKEWIRGPFVSKPGESTLSMLEEDQLHETANDGGLKSIFETASNLHTFWIKVKGEFFFSSFLKDFIYLLLERGEGREKERERNMDV